MNVLLGLLLILNAVFTLFVWPTFFRRVVKDERAFDAQGRKTRFYTVHLVLVIVAIVLALAPLAVFAVTPLVS